MGVHAFVGAWLSLVEHSVRDRGVGGSNPLAPTNLENGRAFARPFFLIGRVLSERSESKDRPTWREAVFSSASPSRAELTRVLRERSESKGRRIYRVP